MLREIIERSHPEGITDNSWSGLDRGSICYCDNCASEFQRIQRASSCRARTIGTMRSIAQWIQWSYARRMEVWDFNNRVTKAAGGPDCLWIGMNSGSISGQSRSLSRFQGDLRARADHHARSPVALDADGFQSNADTGKLIHGLLGWDKLMPESMAMYQMGRPTFRLSAKPRRRSADVDGGGFRRRHSAVVASHRRVSRGPPHVPHRRAGDELAQGERAVPGQPQRRLPASAWSGRSRTPTFTAATIADTLVDQPFRGFTQALIRGRIPFMPVHLDHIEREAAKTFALVLPNVGAMSDQQAEHDPPLRAARRLAHRHRPDEPL